MDSSPEFSKEEGLRLLKAGKIEDAIKVLKKVNEKAEDAQVFAMLGAAYNQKGDKIGAIHAFEESLRISETPKAYYNLAVMYEAVGRVDEAVREYRMATDLDQNYAPAKEALDRLHSKFTAASPVTQPLTGAEPTQAMSAAAAVTAQTQAFSGPPVEPTIGQAPATMQSPIADPFARQSHGPAPTAADLYARQMAKEQAIADQHHMLMRNGLIYGTICGSIFFVLCNFAMKMMPLFVSLTTRGLVLEIVVSALVGAAYGAIVGLWVGYTCGGEGAGLQAGAAMGAMLGLILGILTGSIGIAIVVMVMFAVISGAAGWIIGRLVEASLPD